MRNEKLSLNDLFVTKDTEIELQDDVFFRLHFDTKDFEDNDIIFANYNLLKFKDVKKHIEITKQLPIKKTLFRFIRIFKL